MNSSLALLLQEPLSAVARIRRGGAVANVSHFRKQLIQNFSSAEEQARVQGYSGKSVKLAIFAVATMVDETVLGPGHAEFSEWHRQTLCLQLFNTNLGGEIFFDNCRQLLEAQASTEIADTMEVYLLCLLLGYAGRYNSESAEIRQLARTLRSSIDRTRSANYALPKSWVLPAEPVAVAKDTVASRLKMAAIIAGVLVVLVFGGSKWFLLSGASYLKTQAATTGGAR